MAACCRCGQGPHAARLHADKGTEIKEYLLRYQRIILSACGINNYQLLRSCCTRQQHAVAQLEEPANNYSASPGSPLSSAATMHWLKIELLAAVAGWAASSAGANVPIARNWLRGICPRAEDVQELGRKLSCRAKIYFPGSDEFGAASARWSALGAPKVNVVVVPGTENDVAETVFSSFFFTLFSSPISCFLFFYQVLSIHP